MKTILIGNSAKENESIIVEVDLSIWNEEGERIN
jgi:hypothetical protein